MKKLYVLLVLAAGAVLAARSRADRVRREAEVWAAETDAL